ncbi:MAG: TolC family protein [Deltaproteobacteria bacterium]
MKTRIKILTIVIAILLLSMGPSWASDDKTISLKLLIDETLSNNPEIRAAKARWEATKAAIPQAKSLENPVLSVMFDKIPNSSVNPGESMERQYSITQGFLYPGKLSLMGKMAEKEAQIIFEEYKGKERDIIRDIKAAYYDLFMIYKSIEVNLDTKEILHHLSKIAEARYATGLVSQWDVLKAQIELSQLANEIIILKQEEESAKARINRLLNRPIESPLGKPASINDEKNVPPLELMGELALQGRPELKGMERFIEKEETGLNLAKKGYYPDFMVRLARREEDGSAAGWVAEFGVTIPLWFRTKQDYAVKESVSRLESAKNEYQGMRNMVSFEIKDAIVKIRSAKSLVDLHKSTHIPQAEQALMGARIGYETGKVDFFALMESWKTVKSYKLEYYKSLATFEQAWADLERAVGKELP